MSATDDASATANDQVLRVVHERPPLSPFMKLLLVLGGLGMMAVMGSMAWMMIQMGGYMKSMSQDMHGMAVDMRKMEGYMQTMSADMRAMGRDMGAMGDDMASMKGNMETMSAKMSAMNDETMPKMIKHMDAMHRDMKDDIDRVAFIMSTMAPSIQSMGADMGRMRHDMGKGVSSFSSPMNYMLNMGR